jgi:hypothetical protein
VRRPSQPVWYSLLAMLVSMVVLTTAGIVYTNRATRESERKWCEFITVLDDAWSSTPPQSTLGRAVAASLHKLRTDFGC